MAKRRSERRRMTKQSWRFYGRETEMAQLRAAFLAPQFGLVAIRGRRVVGKSRLLRQTVRGLPEDRPAFLFRAHPWDSPEDLQGALQDALRRARRKRPGIGRPLDSAGNPLRELPQVLESLLRHGVGVAIDDAHYLLSDKLPGLVPEIAAMARGLRREEHGAGSGLLSDARRGALVLAGWDHLRTRDLLAALGPAVTISMALEPWPAATLLAVARDRGWLGWPRRLALVRAVYGGMPLDWARFSGDRMADFAAWRDDDEWRRAFADRIVKSVTSWGNVAARAASELPETLRILEHIARCPEGEAGAGALSADFPDMAPDRLEARLKELCDKRLRLEPVPAFPGAGGASNERWRIYDPEFRFWVDAGMPRILQGARRLHTQRGEIECLAKRMEAMEKIALAQFRRDCGKDWTEPQPAPGYPERVRAGPGMAGQAGDPQVERRAFAFAFDATAPGVLEGMLIPYGVPIRTGDSFEEVFEPGSLTVNGLLVAVPPEPAPTHPPGKLRKALPRSRPLARPGQGLELRDGPDGLRATVTLPDTIDGRRVSARVDAGELTAFSAAFQAIDEDRPAPERRIVRRARLVGLALVDRPEHESPPIDKVPARQEAV